MPEVIPGIFCLPLPLPVPGLGDINAYLVRDSNRCLLVDTGWNTPDMFDSLQGQLAEIGVRLSDITRIAVTHVHPDHFGLAGRLKQLSGASIALHRREVDFIESRYIHTDSLLGQVEEMLGHHGVSAELRPEMQTASLDLIKVVVPVMPDVVLHGGETIAAGGFEFQVLWTPGHSPGHLSFYEPRQKVLLSGDHILSHITPNIPINPQSGPNPLGDYLKSLKAMKKLDVSLVLPGHGNPFPDFQSRIEQLIQHHQARNSNILEVLGAGSKTAFQIAQGVSWGKDTGGISWNSLSSWDKRMAVMETLSHLEEMRARNKLDIFTSSGVVYYQPAPVEKGG